MRESFVLPMHAALNCTEWQNLRAEKQRRQKVVLQKVAIQPIPSRKKRGSRGVLKAGITARVTS
jgi:hypothetical protein